jgi:hypothetical protein
VDAGRVEAMEEKGAKRVVEEPIPSLGIARQGNMTMIDDDTLKKLLRVNDELIQLCKWLNESRDMATSSRLIPLVDDLTHILIEAGKNKLH